MCLTSLAAGRPGRFASADRLVGQPDHDIERGFTEKLVFEQEKKGDLELGEHTWRFSFELPRDAAPSHADPHREHHLIYSIEAFVDIPRWPGAFFLIFPSDDTPAALAGAVFDQ